jgi:putative PIN family toxin of toxin-antitoxin system
MIRIVVDTNRFVSALINVNSRTRLNQILKNELVEILLDKTLLKEIYEVINRPKFSKYISKDQIYDFFELLVERSLFVYTKATVKVSPDPKHDFLLALCKDGRADYLLTGNKIDLLDIKQFEQTKILSLTEFLDLQI